MGSLREDQVKIVEAVAKEIMAGNGPVRLDTSTGAPEELATTRGRNRIFIFSASIRSYRILGSCQGLRQALILRRRK